MPTRRVLKAVLHNFLGAYVSRNSNYSGYWLFGFLISDLDRAEFDLLAAEANASGTPISTARELAASTFADGNGTRRPGPTTRQGCLTVPGPKRPPPKL